MFFVSLLPHVQFLTASVVRWHHNAVLLLRPHTRTFGRWHHNKWKPNTLAIKGDFLLEGEEIEEMEEGEVEEQVKKDMQRNWGGSESGEMRS